MRLPTVNQMKSQSQALSLHYNQLSQLQLKESTGKNLLRSSDDPLLADKINSVKGYLSQLKNFDLSISMAENRTDQKAFVAKQTLELIGKSKELLQAAQNDTANNADRLVISQELQGILVQLVDLSNTRDENGEYIYSGFQVNSPPFKNVGSDYIYQGGDDTTQIAIGLNTKINYAESGYQVFNAIPTGNGVFSTRSDTVANVGTGIISGGTLAKSSAYIPDHYTLSIVNNSQGHLAYQITGDQTGQIIPVPPLTSPSDAPDYKSGVDIEFNGINVQLSGEPQVGDTFHIELSEKQNIFKTLSKLIEVLKIPLNSDKSKADFQQQLGGLSDAMYQITNHFISYEVEIGNQGNIIDNQKALSSNLILNEENKLSNLSDTDMPKVIGDLLRQLTILQLTQETYSKVQQTYYSLLTK